METDDPHVLDLIAGATVIEAIYLAIETNPDNAFCKQAREEGVEIAITFMKKTPADVQLWVMKEHNRYHGGRSVILVQMYCETFTAKIAWEN